MLSALLSFLTGLIATTLKGVVADWLRDRELKKAGANEAAIKTQQSIQEISDAQHQNDMRDRGGASDVAQRLRDRIGSGGGKE